MVRQRQIDGENRQIRVEEEVEEETLYLCSSEIIFGSICVHNLCRPLTDQMDEKIG